MFMLLQQNNTRSSREQIKIRGVKDNVLLLPDDKYRIILEVSSVNFELKSEEEQDMIIDNYQNFLNALPCSLQILFRVRATDIEKYLESFEEKIKSENNKKQKEQLKNYSAFVNNLVSSNKILSRKFYLILPLDNPDSTDFKVISRQLKLLEDIIKKGLEHLGIQAYRLNDLEILDLFYGFYNPEQSKVQSISSQTLDLINQAYL